MLALNAEHPQVAVAAPGQPVPDSSVSRLKVHPDLGFAALMQRWTTDAPGDTPAERIHSHLDALRLPAFGFDAACEPDGRFPLTCDIERDGERRVLAFRADGQSFGTALIAALGDQLEALVGHLIDQPDATPRALARILPPLRFDLVLAANTGADELRPVLEHWADEIGLPARVRITQPAFSGADGAGAFPAIPTHGAVAVLTTPEELLGAAPPDVELAEINADETRALRDEIFVHRSYLRHGIELRDGAVVLDVGANIGVFTVFCHREAEVTVHAVEPAPEVAALLRANVERHGVRAVVHEAACSDHDGEADFTYYRRSSLQSGLQADPVGDREVVRRHAGERLPSASDEQRRAGVASLIEGRHDFARLRVRVRSVSSLIHEHGIERIDLLKVDAEGSEEDILRGIRDEHWPRIDQVVVEAHGAPAAIAASLAERGFVVAREDDAVIGHTLLYARRQGARTPARSTRVATVSAAAATWTDHGGYAVHVVLLPSTGAAPDAVVQCALAESVASLVGVKLVDLTRSDPAEVAIGTALARCLTATARPPTKAIVVDADDTLWRGICGEVGVEGVSIDLPFLTVQRFLGAQRAAGRALCLCSRNNPEDIEAVFARRPEMLLQLDDFAATRIGWGPKGEAVVQMLDELAIDPESAVYVDDDPAVRQEVQMRVPGMTVVDLPADAERRLACLETTWQLDAEPVTAEDAARTEHHRATAERRTTEREAASFEEYLHTLDLEVDITPSAETDIARLSQLARRTNQFNASLRRHGPADVLRLVATSAVTLSVRVRDRFGDYGLVGFAAGSLAGAALEVTDLMLSCRALGRNVEWAMARELAERGEVLGAEYLKIVTRRGARNRPALAFAEEIEGRLVGNLARLDWRAIVSAAAQPSPSGSRPRSGEAKRWPAPVDLAATTAALSARTRDRPSLVTPHVPARTVLEMRLASVWTDVVGITGVGIHDGLFALGADSLTALRLASRLAEELGRPVSLASVLDHPTIAALASHLVEQHEETPAPPCAEDLPLQATHGQRRLWAAESMSVGASDQIIPLAYRLSGAVDPGCVEDRLRSLVARHTALRTRLVPRNGALFQEPAMPEFTLERLAPSGEETFFAAPFDPDSGCLLRAGLTSGAGEQRLLLALHHSAADGWSVDLLERELTAAELPEMPPAPFAVYAAEVAERERRGEFDETLGRLEAEFPAGPGTPTRKRGFRSPAALRFDLHCDSVAASASAYGTTPFALQVAAFALLLGVREHRDDIVLGFVVANRKEPAHHAIVGFLANLVPLCISIERGGAVEDFVRAAGRQFFDAMRRSDLPYGLWLAERHGDPYQFGSPLSAVVTQQQPRQRALQFDSVRAEPVDPAWWPLPFDLMLDLEKDDNGAAGLLRFDATALGHRDAQAVADAYGVLLRSLCELPAEPLTLVCDVAADIMKPRAARLRGPRQRLEATDLPALVARHHPDAVAVADDRGTLTYGALEVAVVAMEERLAAHGVQPGDAVVVRLRRDAGLIVALLAIMRRRAHFVPLDPSYPPGRIAAILEDSTPRLIVDETFAGVRVGCPALRCRPNDLAYVLYTSGSTGHPKGVAVTHESLANYLLWAREEYTRNNGWGSIVHSSIGVDLTLTSVFVPLVCGETVHLLASDDPEHLATILRRTSRLSFLKLTPGGLALLREQLTAKQLTRATTHLVLGGEQLRAGTIAGLIASDLRITNEYGPTETVVGSIAHTFVAGTESADPVPIGVPIWNTDVDLIAGEIVIGGRGVASGYLNRPEQTAERFAAGRYRTGDLACRRDDGLLEYVGRKDRQLKIHGFRLDPGEVEAVLERHPSVSAASVVTPGGRPWLCAFVVPAPAADSVALPDQLRDWIADLLPAHSRPDRYEFLDALPLTPAGKVDVCALAERPTRSDSVPPRERPLGAVRAAWERLLGVSAAHDDDNFFALGGDSILALHLVAELRAAGLELTIQDVIAKRTLGAIARTSRPALPRRGQLAAGKIPLTANQRAFFALEPDFPNEWTITWTFAPAEPIDPDRLRAAVVHVERRHPALRTRFTREEDGWRARIASGETGLATSIEALDLSSGPLGRLALVEDGDGRQEVVWRIHHLVADIVSLQILTRELWSAYEGQPTDDEDEDGYVAFARSATGPARPFPGLGKEPAVLDDSVAGAAALASPAPRRALAVLAAALLSALPDPKICCEHHGRDADGLHDAVGWFTTFRTVTRPAAGAADVDAIHRSLCEEAVADGPLPTVALNFAGALSRAHDRSGIARWSFPSAPALFELQLTCWIVGDALQTAWSYAPDCYSAEHVRGLADAFAAHFARLSGAPSEPEVHPATAVQQGMVLASLSRPRAPLFVEQLALPLARAVDVDMLRSRLDQLAGRHPVLRTAFTLDGGTPRQVIHAGVSPELEVVDDSACSGDAQETRLSELMERYRVPFDLEHPPLLRVALQQRATDNHVLVWTHHHAILDGWSQMELIDQLLAGEDDSSDPPAPFARYAASLNGTPPQDVTDAFWRRELGGFFAPPPLRPRPVAPGVARHGLHEQQVTSTNAVQAWARGAEVSPASAVIAAWALVSSRLRAVGDVLLGVTIAGRSADRPETIRMIGPLARTVPLRVDVDHGGSFAELARRVQERLASAAEHADSAPPASYDSAIAVANYPCAPRADGPSRSTGGLTLLPLTLVVTLDDAIGLRIVNDRARIDDAAAATALSALVRVLERLAAGIDTARLLAGIAAVPPLSAAPRAEDRAEALDAIVHAFSGSLAEPDVDGDTDFLAHGGDSLGGIRLLERLRSAFGVELTLRDLMEAGTPRALRQRIEERDGAADPAPQIVPRPDDHSAFALSDIQAVYWAGRQGDYDLGGVDAHLYAEVEVPDLDVGRFERCWRALIERHAMLRAVVTRDGRQRVVEHVPPYEICVTDLRGRPPDTLADMRARLSAPRRSLEHWPLFTIEATLLDSGVTRLFLSFDLLIGDAFSWRILYHELSALYVGGTLPPLEVTYRDYVEWLSEQRASVAYARDAAYWRNRLAALPAPPALPVARTPADVRDPRFARRTLTLDAERTTALRSLASTLGATLSGLLLTGFAEILDRYAEDSEMLLNLTLFRRPPVHEHINRVVGDFTTLVPVAFDAAGGTFADRVRRVQKQVWSDLSHTAYNGVEVLRDLARACDSPTAAVAPVVFTSTLDLAQADRPASETELLPFGLVWGIGQTPQVTLDYQVYERNGRLTINWDAVDQIFFEGVLDDMFAAHAELLDTLATTPSACDEAHPGAATPSWPPAEPPLGGAGLLHSPFVERAEAAPNAVAVIAGGRRFTYGETLDLAQNCAARLADDGGPVAVVMEKGWEQVVAVVAASLAGRPFVPMEADWPAARLNDLIARTRATTALTQRRVASRVTLDVRVIAVDEPAPNELELEAPPASPAADDVAYVIFTSGSTGRPKGVMVQHRAALNTVLDVNERFGVGCGDRVLALSPLAFDLAIYDVFGLLAAGGAIVMPTEGERRDPARWSQLINDHGVTVWNSVPVLMEMLTGTGRPVPSVLLCLLSGDWIPLKLPAAVRARAPDAKIISLGGATEGSIWSICHELGELGPSWSSVPYGRAMTGQTVEVLGRDGLPAPPWVSGEIHVGGHGLAVGYWDEPELTAHAFVRDPLNGRRLYRTGDWGRMRPGGLIEFLGRRDAQVKVSGHRVELQEIEVALRAIDGVTQAAVVATGEPSARRLTAHVAGATPAEDVRTALAARLPYYMVPSEIVKIDELPLSATGKIDRARLAEPSADQELVVLVAALVETAGLGPDSDLFSQGMTSVDVMRLFNSLEERYGVRPDLEAFYREPTIRTLAAAIPRDSAPAVVEAVPSSPWSAYTVLTDPDHRAAFRALRPAFPPEPSTHHLAGPREHSAKRRPSPRRFSPARVSLEAFSNLLGCLARAEDRRFKYPSAGGLYGVTAHVHVRPSRVGDLAAGLYAYHPEAHDLAPMIDGFDIDAALHHGTDNGVLADTAAFTVFLTTDPADSAPLYGREAERLALLNAGYIGQLLCTAATERVALCPLNGFHFDRLRWLFPAPERVQLLHLLVGGIPE